VIPKYISELFLRFDTVILPGLGAFILQNVPAEIKGETIVPPGKALCFNQTVKNNDGVLANYISEKEGMSFFDACARILEYVENTTKELNAGKEVSLERIGVLKNNSSGEIIFFPFSGTNYSVDSFGLTAIHAAPISKSVNKETAISSQRKKRKIPSAAIWIVAVVLLIGAGSAAVYFLKPDLLQKIGIVYKQQENKISENNVSSPHPVIDTAKVNQPDSSGYNMQQGPDVRYYIIAASFRIKENADNYVVQLNSQGNKSESIFMPEKNLYAVSYNVFSDKAEAEQALERFKATGNAAAWILEK
jgi:hypothetical protein